MSNEPITRIAKPVADDVVVRGKSLCRDLIGQHSFSEMLCWLTLGSVPDPDRVACIDACMVALMEHGLTPSALATRLVYSSTPEAMQAGVAAGLLAVGDRFVGTVEGCGRLLSQIIAAKDRNAEAHDLVRGLREARASIPGFGHPTHKPDDPRTPRLLEVAMGRGVAGEHVSALCALGTAVDAELGRHLTINATGAVAAVLGDCGVPAEIMRGFALVARCAGLVAHVREEQTQSTMAAIWHAAESAVPYKDG